MRRIDAVAGGALLLGVWAAGCGGPEEPPIDGSVDAPLPEQDAGSDASTDASRDAAIDASDDAGTDGGRDAGAPGCTPEISLALLAHLDEATTSGWRAQNVESAMLMHGCTGAAAPLECLATEPLASETEYGATWDTIPGTRMRVLHTTSYATSYWTRSSPDGRFVARGGGSPEGASVIDLEHERTVAVDAAYHPSFFPDGRGFVFHGGSGGVCDQGVLALGAPTRITFEEAGCSATTLNINAQVGASVTSGEYWALGGDFVPDDGPVFPLSDPGAPFGAAATARLSQLTFDGSSLVMGASTEIALPFEGDAVLSPSTRLLIARAADAAGAQDGLVVRRIDVTDRGGTRIVETSEIGRYCATGGTPAFSYDERWIALHHYVGGAGDADAIERGFTGADDPAYALYRERGASDVYLVDLRTGAPIRVSGSAPGQYALFPHFRSDGWIYFVVRTLGSDVEHLVASDAALVLASR